MNDSNLLETQLESWTPRRPSPKLKQRIFAAAEAVAAPQPRQEHSVPAWAKFAPAMCIALLSAIFCLSPAREKQGYLAVSRGSNALAGLSSELTGFCATNTRSEHENLWNPPSALSTFSWTNAGHSVTTTRPVPL